MFCIHCKHSKHNIHGEHCSRSPGNIYCNFKLASTWASFGLEGSPPFELSKERGRGDFGGWGGVDFRWSELGGGDGSRQSNHDNGNEQLLHAKIEI